MNKTKGEKLNFIQHWRKRPDAFIGSIVTTSVDIWVAQIEDSKPKLYEATVQYNPGLLQIIYEILSNAVDNRWRSNRGSDPMTYINFGFNSTTGSICVENDGIPISCVQEEYEFTDPTTQVKSTKRLYPAELFFGYDLSGTNYHDDEERKTSGRNGIGAKATNVFSTTFVVEHTDVDNRKQFSQSFSDGMTKRTVPEIKAFKGSKSWTRITFTPDYEYFKYPKIDENLKALMTKMAVDTAMITGLAIRFIVDETKTTIKIPSLTKYAELFFSTKPPMMHFESADGECVIVDTSVIKSPDADMSDTISQISFVNGIATRQGGVHVERWRDIIIPSIVRTFNGKKPKKGKDPVKTSAKDLYPYFLLFVRCELDKPAFAQQTKEFLTSPQPTISKPTEDDIKKMMRWNFISLLEEKLEFKAARAIARKDGAKRTVSMGDKLQDANWAGSNRSNECTLFITEGLSAKSFALAGISVLENGQDSFGAFAIKGKFMNVRNASPSKIASNDEIQALQTTLGIVPGTDYTSDEVFKSMRYGKICVLADQDDDGIHIRGLLAVFFWTRFRSLFKRDGFISSMSTPLIRINKSIRSEPIKEFYNNADYQSWIAKDGLKTKGIVSYYKGLGTFTPTDAPAIFENRKSINLFEEGDEDEYVPLGFDSSESDERKAWITRDMKTVGDEDLSQIDSDAIDGGIEFVYEGDMSLSMFIDSQVRLYDKMTLRRALPCIIDGFKESHRKAVYGIVSENLKTPRTVEELAGCVKKVSKYHHGANSLEDTIIGMAQGFVGSNNIPLLLNAGMVGTRNGDDAAAARYVKTMPEDILHSIISKEDSPILNYMIEDGEQAEPRFYLPSIPLVLVNGAEGIATGFSTNIPCYNPLDLVCWIKAFLSGSRERPTIVPWYRDFKGEIEIVTDSSRKMTHWLSKGILVKESDGWWHVRELPIGMSISTFKTYVEEKLMNYKTKDGKIRRLITDMKCYNTPNSVHFMLKAAKDFTPDMNVSGNLKCLQNSHSLKNMVLLNSFGYPIRYENVDKILEEFAIVRLYFYGKRKEYLEREYARRVRVATSKAKFITLVNTREIDIRQDISRVEEEITRNDIQKEDDSYDFLLNMPLRSQTKERVEVLKIEAKKISEDLEALKRETSITMWQKELIEFENAYKIFLKTRKDDVTLRKKSKK